MDKKENSINGTSRMKTSVASALPLGSQVEDDNLPVYKLKYLQHTYMRVKRKSCIEIIHH